MMVAKYGVYSCSFIFMGILKHMLLCIFKNILVTSNKSQCIQSLISKLNLEFALKDLTPIHYLLGIEGIEATSTSTRFHLSQRLYISDLLENFDFEKSKIDFTYSFLGSHKLNFPKLVGRLLTSHHSIIKM